MHPESECVPQDIKMSNILKAASKSKLNPRKKPKDSQNNKSIKPMVRKRTDSLDLSTDSFEKALNAELASLRSACQKLLPERPSKDNDGHIDVEAINPISSGKKDENETPLDEELKIKNSNPKELPSQLWWVPPLKEPSIYRSPSVTMSSKSYSLISSICRPRVIHSAEDLRKKVISECKRLEAKSCDEISDNNEGGVEELQGEGERISLNESEKTPSSSCSKSCSPTESTMTITLKTAYPKKPIVGETQSLSGIFDFQTECGNDVFSRFETELDFKVSGGNSFLPVEEKIISTKAVQSIPSQTSMGSQTSFRSQGSQYENTDCRETVRFCSIGELTRKHIINPMAAQLARLCMKQGQLYMNVLDDLEKSCDELESACSNGTLEKLD